MLDNGITHFDSWHTTGLLTAVQYKFRNAEGECSFSETRWQYFQQQGQGKGYKARRPGPYEWRAVAVPPGATLLMRASEDGKAICDIFTYHRMDPKRRRRKPCRYFGPRRYKSVRAFYAGNTKFAPGEARKAAAISNELKCPLSLIRTVIPFLVQR